jgi:hypothetical protein
MKANKVEIYTAGCPLCDETVKEVKNIISEDEIIIYNLNKADDLNKARKYEINRVPAVVVNGRLLNCCKNNKVNKKELIEALGQN